MASVRLERLRKVFPGGQVGLAELSLEVGDGELVVLVGPSGCGKSTALRLVAGLERPSSGRVYLDARDVTALPPGERDLAMVFQSYALYPHKTVRENLAFPLRMRRRPRVEIERRVGEVARTLGLDELLERRPRQLSGGQRQRVALGRAMVRAPAAFLLDEPLSNLDAKLRTEMRAELSRLHHRLGATMLLVTHDQEEAMTLGDRIVVLRRGAVEQAGSPRAVYERPVNLFVAEFIGSPSMNCLPCQVAEGPRAIRLVGAGFALDLPAPASIPPAGARVVLGIRPEDLELVETEAADLRGRIEVVEDLGRTSVLHVRAAEVPPLRVVVPDPGWLRVGDVAGLRLRRERLHLFDAASGVRLAREA